METKSMVYNKENNARIPYLGNPKETAAILQKYNFNFQKKFGQNFLIDDFVLEKIVKAADIQASDVVLEIGPGIGTLTQFLAAKAKKVIAVEIDKTLFPILSETLQDYDNVELIHADILKLDLKSLNIDQSLKVIANLPYYITTPIIMGLFEEKLPLKSLTLMVQKEVATRISSGPGSKDYGALSLAVQFYAKPTLVANVPQHCFMPRPTVASAVLHLEAYPTPPLAVQDEKLLFQLIRASFNQRRKTLANGIKNFADFDFTKEEIEAAILSLGKGLNIRGETLTLEEFAYLSDVFAKRRSL